MYIESVPNRNSPPAILLRESYREGGKVRKRTLLNLSDWPSERIAGFKALLKGGTVIPSEKEAISIIRSLPHGHVAAALGTARRIGLDRLIGPDGNRRRDLVLKQRFGLDHVVLVGDRGMITDARIAEDIQPAGLDWITALRAPAIRGLLDGGAFQMSLFDDRDMATITSPDFPGERLILCRNAALAAERARKREDLLRATERDLAPIAAAVRRKREPLRGKADIGLAVGAVIGKHKMAKHFALDITDTSFAFARKTAAIAEEAALDGLYAVRTSLPETALDDSKTVKSYKSLSLVEHAIRSIKTVDLHVRPVYHWLEDRVRAHVFLCMLAYYLEWHMRQRLAPMLYDDTDKEAAEALRKSPVAKAERSPAALAKQTTGRTDDGLPVHSFHTLLHDLATVTKNTVATALAPDFPFTITTRPTHTSRKSLRPPGHHLYPVTHPSSSILSSWNNGLRRSKEGSSG